MLLTPRLDAQTTFAKLFADIGIQKDVRQADLVTLLAVAHHRPSTSRSKPFDATCGLKHSRTRVASRHTLPLSCLAPPKALGRDELQSYQLVLPACEGSLSCGPPNPYGLIGMVQTVHCYNFTAHSTTTWTLDPEVYPFEDRPQHILDTTRPLKPIRSKDFSHAGFEGR